MRPEQAVKQLPPKLARALKATMRQKKAADDLRKKKDAQLAAIDNLGANTPSVDNPKEMDKAVEQQMSQELLVGTSATGDAVASKSKEDPAPPAAVPVPKKSEGVHPMALRNVPSAVTTFVLFLHTCFLLMEKIPWDQETLSNARTATSV